MNRALPVRLEDIVTLGGNGLPRQVWRLEHPIGPAFHSEAEALPGNEKRHTAEILLHASDGRLLLSWWEVSQSELPARLGHTEQKALLRMRLKRGIYVLIQGTYPCCPYNHGCMNALADLAEIHDCVFEYRAAMGNAIYRFERVGKRSAVRRL